MVSYAEAAQQFRTLPVDFFPRFREPIDVNGKVHNGYNQRLSRKTPYA